MVTLSYAFNDHGISNKSNNIRNTPLALLFDHFLQLITDLEKNAKFLLPSSLRQIHLLFWATPKPQIAMTNLQPTAHLLNGIHNGIALWNS